MTHAAFQMIKKNPARAMNLLLPDRAIMRPAENNGELNRSLLRYVHESCLYIPKRWFLAAPSVLEIDFEACVIGAESARGPIDKKVVHTRSNEYPVSVRVELPM